MKKPDEKRKRIAPRLSDAQIRTIWQLWVQGLKANAIYAQTDIKVDTVYTWVRKFKRSDAAQFADYYGAEPPPEPLLKRWESMHSREEGQRLRDILSSRSMTYRFAQWDSRLGL
jgi:hypothetical protein